MKKFKIYGTKYDLEDAPESAVDSYAYKSALVDEVPKRARLVGYTTMEDGSVVECYKGKSKLWLVLATLLLAVVAGGVYIYVTYFYHPEIAIGGTMLETTVNKNVVTFNGIMSTNNGMCDIRFVNGEYPATVTVTGEGVTSEPIFLESYAAMVDMPVTVTSTDSVVEVLVRIESEGDIAEFNAILEVPENNNAYDTQAGLNGHFDKELVFDENQ